MPSAEPPVRAPAAPPAPQADSGAGHATVISNLAFNPNPAGAAKLSIFAASIVSTAAGVVALLGIEGVLTTCALVYRGA